MHDLVLLDRHEAELRTLLDMGSGIEAAAYVVFGRSVIRRDPWIGNARIRLVSHRVIPISADSSSLIGSLKGRVKIKGDILSTGIRWNAES